MILNLCDDYFIDTSLKVPLNLDSLHII